MLVALLVVVVGTTAFVLWDRLAPRASTTVVTTQAPERQSAFWVLEADSTGALILNVASGAVLGVDAQGFVVWTHSSNSAGSDVVCAAACPQAIVSGSIASHDSPLVPTPPVTTLGGAPPPGLPAAFRTFAVAQHGRAVAAVQADQEGRANLVITPEVAGPVHRIALPSSQFFTFRSAAGVLLQVQQGESFATIALRPSGNGWRVSPLGTSDTLGGCVGAEAAAFVDHGALVVVDARGRNIVGRATQMNECGFTTSALVVSETQSGPAGTITDVSLWPLSGSPGWHHHYEEEVRLAAAGTQVLLTGPTVHAWVSQGGTVKTAPTTVADAWPLIDGSWVLVSHTGAVTWTQRP